MLNKGWIKIAPGKNPQIRVEHIKKIPISSNYISDAIIKELSEKAKEIMHMNYKGTSHILEEINSIVYRIYGLSSNDINIIEENI